MISNFLNIFKIPELRRKIAITMGLLFVYRIGAHLPTPFIDPAEIEQYFNQMRGFQGQGVFSVVDMFSGGAFSQMTVFALGIMPYISASIIIQLLTVISPTLERLQKEGEAGRKKMNQWTRYGTVGLSLFQGAGIGIFLYRQNLTVLEGHPIVFIITTAMTMAAGTCFIMWLGEKITEHGIGNGISLIIAVGIVARYPLDVLIGWRQADEQAMTWLHFIGVLAVMAVVAGAIVLTQEANRKIPVQHARRTVGRRMVQGGNTYLPLKLNTAGVIPVIFASAILTFPSMLIGWFPQGAGTAITDILSPNSNFNFYEFVASVTNVRPGGVFNLLKVINPYVVIYALLTFFFCYFYTAITFNPVDLADNLKKSGAFIPGRKPGKPTSDFINYTLVRITVVGALSLIVIALIPEILSVGFEIPYQYASIAGGTGLIIVVGVFLDTMKQIESQLLMRHYEGFTYRGTGTGPGRRVR